MKKKVTLQTIANELGLSKSLVSKALSNHMGVNEETKEKVRLTAINMGYPINSSILSVSSAKTGNVAVLVPREDLSDLEYWGKIFSGIEKELSDHHFSMILSGIDKNVSTKEGMPSCITDRRVDGALILGHVPVGYVLTVQALNIPIVLIDVDYPYLKLDHVLADNFLGGYEAARYLLDHQHCRVGFVGDTSYSFSFAERFRGFDSAVREYRQQSSNEIKTFYITDASTDETLPFSIKQLEQIMQLPERPTAIMCGNDPVAFRVLQMLQGLHIRCPEDVSIIGFDNVQKCNWTTLPLTSIDACKETIGTRAVQLLFRRMNEPASRPERVMITTEIVERNSVVYRQ